MEPDSTAAKALLKYVRPLQDKYIIEMSRAGQRFCKFGADPLKLAAAFAAWHANLDAEGVKLTREQNAAMWQSDLGVAWVCNTWKGHVHDRLETATAGKQRMKNTKGRYYTKDSDVECAAEKATLVNQPTARWFAACGQRQCNNQ
jgi:predicted nucleic acid-binding Zn ribbon protein